MLAMSVSSGMCVKRIEPPNELTTLMFGLGRRLVDGTLLTGGGSRSFVATTVPEGEKRPPAWALMIVEWHHTQCQ